jgi:opacity protein-like surface antigen
MRFKLDSGKVTPTRVTVGAAAVLLIAGLPGSASASAQQAGTGAPAVQLQTDPVAPAVQSQTDPAAPAAQLAIAPKTAPVLPRKAGLKMIALAPNSLCNFQADRSRSGMAGTTGWYLGLSGGWQSRKISDDVGIGTGAEFGDGFALNAATGYRFPIGVRIEAEASYQNNRNHKFVHLDTGQKETSVGNVGLRSFMFNVAYDVTIKSQPRIKPYVSGGVGIYQSSINGFTAPSLAAGGVVLSTASTEVRAWQYRLGVNYAVGRQSEVWLGYRHFLGTRLRFNFIVPGNPNTLVPLNVTGGNTEGVEFGIRRFF